MKTKTKMKTIEAWLGLDKLDLHDSKLRNLASISQTTLLLLLPSQSPGIRPHPLRRLRALHPLQPTNAVLDENLLLRREDSLLQIKVVDRTDPRDQHARDAGRDAVHERAADGAEVVLHRVAARDRLALRELGELVAAARVHRLGLLDDEVGGEHRGGDLAAVAAVADEGVD
jgi:hypothetical protein